MPPARKGGGEALPAGDGKKPRKEKRQLVRWDRKFNPISSPRFRVSLLQFRDSFFGGWRMNPLKLFVVQLQVVYTKNINRGTRHPPAPHCTVGMQPDWSQSSLGKGC